MQSLYQQCLSKENIVAAIKWIIANTSCKPGKDNIGFENIESIEDINRDQLVRKIKLILRRYKRVSSTFIKDFKEFNYNCEYGYNLYNLYDRIAQRAVYQVLDSYINLPKQNAKQSIISAINILQTTKRNFIVNADLQPLASTISLSACIKVLQDKYQVNDLNFCKTIKHVIWQSKEYNGIGLDPDNELSLLLLNIYFQNLDEYIEGRTQKTHPSFNRNFKLHKDNYIEWRNKLGKKIFAQYYRQNLNAVVICHSRVEQLEVLELIQAFNTDIKTELMYNKLRLSGFYVKKNKLERNYLEIRIDKLDKLKQYIRSIKFNSFYEVWNFKKWLAYIVSYYDIVNDMTPLFEYIIGRCFFRSQRNNSHLKKVPNHSIYYFEGNDREIYFDIYAMRKASRISYKEYMFKNGWTNSKDYIEPWKDKKYTIWGIYRQMLFVRQRGKDILTNKSLDFKHIHIHHLIHRKDGGKDIVDNLILISDETHNKIHSNNIDKRMQNKLDRLIADLRYKF